MMRTASIAVGIAVALVSPVAWADDPPQTPPDPGIPTQPPTQKQPEVRPRAGAAPAVDAKPEEVPDHELVTGKLAVGYLGVTQLPLGQGGAANVTRGSVDAPVIGVRYWISPKIGIDAGLGLGLTGGSREVAQNNTTVSTDLASPFGLVFHGGVPLVFGYVKHYKFLAVPELNVGFARQTDRLAGTPAPPDISRSGFRFDVGARIGTEIHFGFIGIPQLSLQATVGLFFRRQVWKNSQEAGPGVAAPQSSSEGETRLGTSVQADPWAIFVNNISAFYYFP